MLGNTSIELPILVLTIQDALGLNDPQRIKVISPEATPEKRAELSAAMQNWILSARKDRSLWRGYYDFKNTYAVPLRRRLS